MFFVFHTGELVQSSGLRRSNRPADPGAPPRFQPRALTPPARVRAAIRTQYSKNAPAHVHVTKPYEFIGFGAMDVTKPFEFIGFGAVDVTKPF